MARRILSALAAVFAIAVYYYTNQFVDVHATDEQGFTALHHAAAQGDLDILRSQIAHGADVNAKEPSK
jgi:ankyrin repeat protein